ncbi:MAG TPA: 3-deoxy-7-phosphoheptulonate synthase [Candidatus Latescibacteria bacterium]|nr:3-deoxy-7-phosphoheptulonate synthase [Candidatus Latescibacterota bacterium]
MIVILRADVRDEDVKEVVDSLTGAGYRGADISRGVEKTVVGAIGRPTKDKGLIAEQLKALPFVEDVVLISKPYKLVSREFHPERTVIKVGDVEIGGEQVVVMAGPCSVESRDQLLSAARVVKEAGAHILRGGAFKPSTSPYSFRGLGEEGLKILAEARNETGLPVITEVMDTRDVELVTRYADILQIGTRNMANFSLLQEVGHTEKPVMLKRGMSSTIEEWLQAAEYIADKGNFNIILCERGIRTFEPYTRNTFDVNAIPVVHQLSHLPVLGDPSHGTGRWRLVAPISKAAVAAGADGLLIEIHPNPAKALKDGAQSLTFSDFGRLMRELQPLVAAIGRRL